MNFPRYLPDKFGDYLDEVRIPNSSGLSERHVIEPTACGVRYFHGSSEK